MAKQQGINLLGIQREMLKAGQDNRAQAFVQGAMGAFANINKQNEEAENILQQHMEDLGGIQNINKISPEQRGPVTEFMRNARDEYYKLATEYEKTKSPEIKDKMDAIKFKATSLNEQLSQFAENKAEYLQDFEEGDLMKGGTFAKDNAFFTGVYGNPNAQFSIDQETGDISFTANGETRSFKKFGTHTLRNYEGEQSFESLVNGAAKLKVQGGFLNKASVVSTFINNNKGMSKNDLQALMQTDLTGDESDLSFIQQWANGDLIDKSMYNGVTLVDGKVSEEDVQALLNNKQASLDLMGKYVGNIAEGMFTNTNTDPKILQQQELQQARINALRKKEQENKGELFDGSMRFGPYAEGQEYRRANLTSSQVMDYVADIKAGKRFDFLDNYYLFQDNKWVQIPKNPAEYEEREDGKPIKADKVVREFESVDQMVRNVFETDGPNPITKLNLQTIVEVDPKTGFAPEEIVKPDNQKLVDLSKNDRNTIVTNINNIVSKHNVQGIDINTTGNDGQSIKINNKRINLKNPNSTDYKSPEELLQYIKELVETAKTGGGNKKLDKST